MTATLVYIGIAASQPFSFWTIKRKGEEIEFEIDTTFLLLFLLSIF
jgi:hypothetical protein